MTFARKRMLLGRKPGGASSFSANYAIPSRFLKEIKPGLLTGYHQKSEDLSSAGHNASFDPQSSTPRLAQRTGKDQELHDSFPSHSTRSYEQNPKLSARAIQMSDTAHGAKDSEPFEHLQVGDVVQHTKFGIGQVTQIIGEKDKELYNVDFKTAGKRLLDPRFAKLIKIS
jgi:DNA helicase II / ATP-dependent DNA helicase PcrA